MSKVIDLTGQVFHRLTVVERDFTKTQNAYWRCLCICGNSVTVHGYDLRSGNTKSCGCYKNDLVRERSITHNMRQSNEYNIYCTMISRCHNPNNKCYYRYGGRGITVCQEWRDDFSAFYNHIGPRPSKKHSIDRIDNDLGYMPGNVRWATNIEQAYNKSSNTYYTFNGKIMTLTEWSKETGIKPSTIIQRLKRGWSIEKALSTRLDQRFKNHKNQSGDTLDEAG
jgi:hypothetical protein